MKIVRGNDFRLKIEVFEAYLENGQPRHRAYDLLGATIEVYISSKEQPRKRYEHTFEYNLIYVQVDGYSLWTGDYDVEIVIYRDGNLRIRNRREFSIVEFTGEGDIVPSPEIETIPVSGMLNVVPLVVSGGVGVGVVFIPSVDADGILSWTNNGGLPNPRPVLIQGRDGVDGKDGLSGTNGIDGKDGLPGADGKDGKDGLPGVDGKDGLPGESAYEFAQKGGFSGTEEEFSAQLATIGNINAVLDLINGEYGNDGR